MTVNSIVTVISNFHSQNVILRTLYYTAMIPITPEVHLLHTF